MTPAEEITELKRRLSALEEMVFRRHRVRCAVLRIIEIWPGPFTVQSVEDVLKLKYPEAAAEMKPYEVSGHLRKLEKAGHVARTNEAAGAMAAIYHFVSLPPLGRPGPKFSRRAAYESGFRAMVRRALDDLPPEFTLLDIQEWMANHLPEAKIPYGSWSSTLYKLTQSGELVCIRGRGTNCSARRKVWKIGSVRVTPTGAEAQELETAWREFRKTLDIAEVAQQETSLQRGEAA
jgi:hypothetical protein